MARGGYRPGAGRPKGAKNKPKTAKRLPKNDPKTAILSDPETPDEEKKAIVSGEKTPLEYMLEIMNDDSADTDRRDKMAGMAAPYVHARAGTGPGKKQEKQDRARSAGKGRFSPTAPPKLSAVIGGKK